MFDGLSDQNDDESSLESIGKSLAGLSRDMPTRPEKADCVSESYILGRLYGPSSHTDRPLSDLSTHLREAYGDKISERGLDTLYSHLESEAEANGVIRGKDAVELFRNYQEIKENFREYGRIKERLEDELPSV